MKTKADVDTELKRLEARLQTLASTLPREEVLDAFAEDAAPLTRRAPAEHAAYVQERVHDMLVAAGVIEDDSPTG